MSTPDLSKVIELIMQNPSLISEIQGLVKKDSEDVQKETVAPEEPPPSKEANDNAIAVSTPRLSENSGALRRAQLLSAMKPYVSPERAKAIDSMLAVSEILEAMKTR